jgi:hypothetical protein
VVPCRPVLRLALPPCMMGDTSTPEGRRWYHDHACMQFLPLQRMSEPCWTGGRLNSVHSPQYLVVMHPMHREHCACVPQFVQIPVEVDGGIVSRAAADTTAADMPSYNPISHFLNTHGEPPKENARRGTTERLSEKDLIACGRPCALGCSFSPSGIDRPHTSIPVGKVGYD